MSRCEDGESEPGFDLRSILIVGIKRRNVIGFLSFLSSRSMARFPTIVYDKPD